MAEILYTALAVFALCCAGAIWRNFRRLRIEDKLRATDMARMKAGQQRQIRPGDAPAAPQPSLSPSTSFLGRVFQGMTTQRPTLDGAVDQQHQLAQRLNPQEALVHTTAIDSAERLVSGIALRTPVVVFMDGKADTTQDANTQLLVDLLTSLQIAFKDVDVPADPEMHLGLPQKDGAVDLPYLYIGGLAIGGPAQALEMAQSGGLIAQLDAHDVSYDQTIAAGLVKPT